MQLTSKGRIAARKLIHVQILLLADEMGERVALKDADIAKAQNVSRLTVERVRKRFVEEGIDSAINPKVQTRRKPKKLDGKAEAFLIAAACSQAPEGRSDWTLQLLADRLVEHQIVDSISHECVRQTLKKNELKPWQNKCWVIPPEENADFVCAMEEVLEVSHRDYKEDEVLVCMDETSKQHLKETRTPLPQRKCWKIR